MKTLNKNKKGFTLIEIIVVLVIMGILLAIAVPAILGYVGKANDAKYLAQGRGGYLATQTLSAQAKATKDTLVINEATVNKELGFNLATDTEVDDFVQSINCQLDTTDTTKVLGCNIRTVEMNNSGKFVHYKSNKESEVLSIAKDATLPTFPAVVPTN